MQTHTLRLSVLTLFLIQLFAVSCANSEASKRKYFEQANKFYRDGKYPEAEIAYKKVLKIDPQFGEAIFHLGETQLKRGRASRGVTTLRQAALRMPNHEPVRVILAEIYRTAYLGDQSRPKAYLDELKAVVRQLASISPEGFDTLRLVGQVALIEGDRERAIERLTKANGIKPNETDVVQPLAQALIEEKRPNEAEKLLLTLIDKQPDTEAAYQQLYLIYRAANKNGDAQGVIERWISAEPKAIGPRIQLASHFAAVKKTAEMESTIQDIISKPSDFPGAFMVVGDFMGELGRWPDAIRYFEEGAKATPKEHFAYRMRIADALVRQSKWADAATELDAILAKYPKELEARGLRATVRLAKPTADEVAKAITEFQALAKEYPENPAIHFGLGRAYRARASNEAAIREFQEAIKRKEDYWEARVSLAEACLDEQRYREALQHSEAALAVVNQPYIRLVRAVSLVGVASYPRARSELAQLLKEFPDMNAAQIQMGLLNIAEQRFPEAEAIFRRLYRPGSSDAQTIRGMAELYASQKQYSKAMALLMDELKKRPAYANEVKMVLAETASRSNEVDTAIQHYTELLKESVRPAELHTRLSELYFRKGDSKTALSHLQEAMSINPEQRGLKLSYGSLLEMEGRAQEAQQHYRAVLSLDPENAVALNNLSYSLAETGGNLDEALRMAQRATAARPDQPSFSDTLGWIYYKKNMNSAATQIFEKLVQSDPQNATYRYHLGAVMLQSGNKERARAELQTALQLPTNRELQSKIRQLLAKT